jgi:hypothetical protein
MKEIGGYFQLELSKGNELHKGALRLNTGRNAFEYILKANRYKKIYIPHFTCDVLLAPMQHSNVIYEFYQIDLNLEPVFDYSKIQDDEAFLYTNYFGLKDGFLSKVATSIKNLVVDNAQSFYSKPINGIDTFYSPRKFFGVPDGGYLYCTKILDAEFEKDISFERLAHLIKRIDLSAQAGYNNFLSNEEILTDGPIMLMSNLTKHLLDSIDYKKAASKRKRNFDFLHASLGASNKLKFDLDKSSVPMVYPYWGDDESLKARLLSEKIYTSTYWPNVTEWTSEDMLEHQFARNIVYLPIDQRYKLSHMKTILGHINLNE